MHENKMQTYLGDDYTDNNIINFLNYWMYPKVPRTENDLDCLYLNGDLCADTIFSVWTPMKYVLDCLNPNEKFYKVDNYGPDSHKYIKKIKNNIDLYLPSNEKLVEELYRFVELAETRANVMELPHQDINTQRYNVFFDQMPPMLYNCFTNGIFNKYFNNNLTVHDWVKREKLEMFFQGEISKENIKPLITGMKSNASKWLKDKDEIMELLQNMSEILEERYNIIIND